MLMTGLNTLRSRLSTPEFLWGMREINLANSAMDDAAMTMVLDYAKKEPCLDKLMLQGNQLEVG